MTHVDPAATYDSVLRVGTALERCSNPAGLELRFDHLSDEQLDSRRFDYVKRKNHEAASTASLELLNRAVKGALTESTRKQHQRVVIALAWLIRGAAMPKRSASGRQMVHDITEGVDRIPLSLRNWIASGGRLDARHLNELAGLKTAEWQKFVHQVTATTKFVSAPAANRISVADAPPLDLDVAKRLARMASAAAGTAALDPLPEYDRSESKLRLTHVSVAGFRGSPASVTLDLTRNGKAADVLLWGDNGVGKSTLVDGIEFALQGRVDRSSDFTSGLRPKVRNLHTPEGRATVTLTDGTHIERALTTSAAGRDIPSNDDVRPGFRIAPVVIRRADILRFLDADALSRGAVFFDYFPDPSGGLGVRPDEELKLLEEERSLLRVVRADLVDQLRALYPDEERDLGVAEVLDSFVQDLLLEITDAPGEDTIEALPEDVRRLVHDLRGAQNHLRSNKKKLERGVELLNPVAYRSQLQRVGPALQSVGGELTASFTKITRARHVVALDVLVAKSGPVSLDVVVRFDNGTAALPQQAFSEGYKDLVALLFFLAVTKKAGELGQAKVLVLDDALQSVDASVRVGVMDYVLEHFSDWQLVITGHDRGWLAQLRGLFSRRGRSMVERRISRWSFSEGIHVTGATRLRVDTVRAGLEQHDERMTAAAVGILLEEICQELSWRVGTSVTRREGDRYSIGDMWPGLGKLLRSLGLTSIVDGLNQRLEIRNLLGGHFNDFADSIPWSDTQALAEDVLALYEAVRCEQCDSWVRKIDAKSYACTCALVGLAKD